MWTQDQLRNDILGIFQAHAADGLVVAESSHITGDLGLDSLAVMEIVAEIEDRYTLMIPDELLPKMRSVADVIEGIGAQLRADGRLS
jgi:acyl carrier protein